MTGVIDPTKTNFMLACGVVQLDASASVPEQAPAAAYSTPPIDNFTPQASTVPAPPSPAFAQPSVFTDKTNITDNAEHYRRFLLGTDTVVPYKLELGLITLHCNAPKSVTIEFPSEMPPFEIAVEVARFYESVDASLEQTGFLPSVNITLRGDAPNHVIVPNNYDFEDLAEAIEKNPRDLKALAMISREIRKDYPAPAYALASYIYAIAPEEEFAIKLFFSTHVSMAARLLNRCLEINDAKKRMMAHQPIVHHLHSAMRALEKINPNGDKLEEHTISCASMVYLKFISKVLRPFLSTIPRIIDKATGIDNLRFAIAAYEAIFSAPKVYTVGPNDDVRLKTCYSVIAVSYLNYEQSLEALYYLKKFYEFDSENITTCTFYAKVLQQHGHLDDAKMVIEKLLSINPNASNCPLLLEQYALVFYKKGDVVTANNILTTTRSMLLERAAKGIITTQEGRSLKAISNILGLSVIA